MAPPCGRKPPPDRRTLPPSRRKAPPYGRAVPPRRRNVRRCGGMVLPCGGCPRPCGGVCGGRGGCQLGSCLTPCLPAVFKYLRDNAEGQNRQRRAVEAGDRVSRQRLQV